MVVVLTLCLKRGTGGVLRCIPLVYALCLVPSYSLCSFIYPTLRFMEISAVYISICGSDSAFHGQWLVDRIYIYVCTSAMTI